MIFIDGEIEKIKKRVNKEGLHFLLALLYFNNLLKSLLIVLMHWPIARR